MEIRSIACNHILQRTSAVVHNVLLTGLVLHACW